MCFHGTCLDKLALPCANATTKKARAKASAAEAARRAQSAAKIAQLAKDKKEGAEAEAVEAAAAAAAAAAATTESGKGAELLKEGEDAAAGVEEFKEDEEEEEEAEEEEEEEEPVEEGVSDAAAVADAQLYSDFRATLERGIEVGAPPHPYSYYSTHKPCHSVRRSAAFQCGFSSLCVSLFSR